MKYIAGNSSFCGCFGSSFYNIYCKGLMRRFQEIEILIFSYITASLASMPLLIWVEPFRSTAFARLIGKLGRLRLPGASSCMERRCCSFSRRWSIWTSRWHPFRSILFPYLVCSCGRVLLGERLNTLAMAGSAHCPAGTILIVKYDTSY